MTNLTNSCTTVNSFRMLATSQCCRLSITSLHCVGIVDRIKQFIFATDGCVLNDLMSGNQQRIRVHLGQEWYFCHLVVVYGAGGSRKSP